MQQQKYLLVTAFISLVLLTTSCKKTFLDLQPLDQVTEAAYYTSPDQFKAGSNDFYNKMIGFRPVSSSNIYDWEDKGSDIIGGGYGWPVTSNQTDLYWNNPYSYIRANNVLIQKGRQYTGNYSDIRQYIAAAYFFRAWQHFFLLKRFWWCTDRHGRN